MTREDEARWKIFDHISKLYSADEAKARELDAALDKLVIAATRPSSPASVEVERYARAICLAELTKDEGWFDHDAMMRAVDAHWRKWKPHGKAAAALTVPARPEAGEVEREAAVCDHCGTAWFSTDGRCALCRKGEIAQRTLASLPTARADIGEDAVEGVALPDDVAELVLRIGRAQWGQTPAYDAGGHAEHIAESVRTTAENFDQEGPQHMHGLYIEGTETVICHTGTSPNSPSVARALTGAWNWLYDQAALASLQSSGRDAGEGM